MTRTSPAPSAARSVEMQIRADLTPEHLIKMFYGSQLLPEVSASADGLNNVPSPGELSDDWPSTSATPPTGFRAQPQEGTGLTHHQSTARPESGLVSPSPQRPKFGLDWNVSRRFQRRKLSGKSNSATLPFPLDAQGRPKGLLKYGSRVRVKVK